MGRSSSSPFKLPTLVPLSLTGTSNPCRQSSRNVLGRSLVCGSPREADEAQFSIQPSAQDSDEEANLPVSELIELQKLRKSRQGIDVAKLNKGDIKKKKRKQADEPAEEEQAYGLRPGVKAAKPVEEEEDEDDEDREAKARRAVRTNNFTQQTNALDVDKHMMAYIEENMKLRRGRPDAPSADSGSGGATDDLYKLSDKYKVEKKAAEEGSVTNSLAMLTAIPEVDLGMDARLKNIEETEKAKLVLNQERKDRKRPADDDEAHLAASRFYRPNLRAKSDADIIRDAKLEAMGLPPEEEHHRPRGDRVQMATDEAVMERFKKRMRK